MALDSSQLASLLSVISEENTTTQTLEAIASTFHQFFTKQDHFKIGCALVSLLQNKDLIVHPTQRIACIFFLFDMYRTDPIALNPFASVFTYLVSPPTTLQNGVPKEFHWQMPRLTPQEKYLVSQIITNPSSKDLFKKTPTQILQMDQNNLNLASIDVSGLQVSIVEKLSQLPNTSKVGLPCVITDIEASRYGYDEIAPKNGSEQQKQCIETLLVGPDAPFKKCIKPELIRIAPPLHFEQDELVWLDPIDYVPEFAWDNSILNTTNSSSNTSEIRKLLAKACRSQLNIQQQQQLDNVLSKDSSLVLHLDLNPSKFANLVELNPSIAVKIILAYQELDSIDLSPYLEELLKTKMSVHSMEVVNNLAMLVILPDEFIHLYISTCISKCENMTDDKPLQNRLVRLLCAFIQSLIRNKIIDAKELHIELQPFCIEFSTIREANSLYRLLKSMSNENMPGVSGGGTSSSANAQSNAVPAAVSGGGKGGKN